MAETLSQNNNKPTKQSEAEKMAAFILGVLRHNISKESSEWR